MEIAALIISILTFLFAWRVYTKHDKRLKIQEARINEYQLRKIQEESESLTRAIIDADLFKGQKGARKLIISNKGKAVGRNIIVSIPETKGLHILGVPKAFSLNPGKSLEINMALSYDHPEHVEIKLEWEDDARSNNSLIHPIYL